LPDEGNIFISVCDRDKPAMVPLARELADMGFTIYATRGTSTVLRNAGVPSLGLFRISEGRPNVIDLIRENLVNWMINTPSGAAPRIDEVSMRMEGVVNGVPITTTISGLRAAIKGLIARRETEGLPVCSIQKYHEQIRGASIR
jgi:carbamoyl-phosphate synthase large subunit